MAEATIKLNHRGQTPEQAREYKAGMLGVAVRRDILMDNIQRMMERGFLKESLQELLTSPRRVIGNRHYDMAYTNGEPKRVEVEVRGSRRNKLRRGYRCLAYKILRDQSSHGAEFRVEKGEDYVRVSAIPVVLTVGH